MDTLQFTDTHCHIHDSEFFPEGGQVQYDRALEAGVHRMFCVGTDVRSSQQAVEFSKDHSAAFALVGIHPHDATIGINAVKELKVMVSENIIGIGEIGLDYHYDNSPRIEQHNMLHAQLELAKEYNLPISFHVRDAFDDFWPIFDQYQGLRGVLHSYTDNLSNIEKGLSRGLLVGINGITTFAGDRIPIANAVSLESILLETDAPFLTPVPHRGTVNEPAFVTHVARFVAKLRSISPQELSHITEKNAQRLFF